MSEKDSLGDRMKDAYENRTRVMLPRRTFTVLRVDGKAFHTLTRGFEKPWDTRIETAMDAVMLALCEGVQGATLGYAQSDEVSVIVGDLATIRTSAWFDGNLQKIVSVAASIATRAFNRSLDIPRQAPGALFDCRAFVIPDPIEIENYLVWRQQDAVRNSIQGLAQANFSHKSLHGLNTSKLQDRLMLEKGINWNDCTPRQKRGRCAIRVMRQDGVHSEWTVDENTPTFNSDRDYIKRNLPTRQD